MTTRNLSLLIFAQLAVAISAPLIRLAETHALLVVAWRLTIALPVVLSVALVRREQFPRFWGGLTGFSLAVHWVTWVVAVKTTSLASAALLVSTGAIWSALLSKPLLGEPVGRRQLVGLAIAFVGAVLIVTSNRSGTQTLSGDLCALASAFAWVAYTFSGRRARQHCGFWGFISVTYGTAALVAWPLALLWLTPAAENTFVYRDLSIWATLIGLAIIPTLMGHGTLNYLLKFLGPARVSHWMLLQPLAVALFGWLLFNEVPSPHVLIGGVFVICGVMLGS